MTTSEKHWVFADPRENHVHDDTAIDADGVRRGRYSGKTLEEVQIEHPRVVLIDIDEFVDMVEKRMTTDPVEITEKRYWHLLEVLPPCSWQRHADSESFYMSEFTSGRVTNHIVRVDERYFSFEAPVMANHWDRVQKVRDWLAKQTDPMPDPVGQPDEDEEDDGPNNADEIERRLTREEIIEHLEGYGTACYDHESTRLLAECLAETANTEGDIV